MKLSKLREIIREEIQKLNEASIEGREKYEGLNYVIYYQPPKGYCAKGKGEIKKEIAHRYFDSYDEAQEHAELEIDGYLSD